MEIALLEPDFS